MLLHEGVVYRQHVNKLGLEQNQVIVPPSARETVLQHAHDHMTAGHMGEKRTYQRLKEKYYWVNYKEEVALYCRQCVLCQRRKMPARAAKAPLKQALAGVPLEKIGLDLIGPLPLSHNGFKYLLSVQCYFTKWVEMYPLPDMKVETVADVLFREFICRYGLMRQLVTDQGRQFESTLFQELCKRLDIVKLRSSAFHPATNGLIERMNRTMEDMLSKYITQTQKDWDQWSPVLLLEYRSSVHASTGQTPYQMMFGHSPRLPLDILYGHGPQGSDEYSPDQYVQRIQENLRKCHSQAQQAMLVAAKQQKHTYDVRQNLIEYKTDDQVWAKIFAKKKGICPKLSTKWAGPFKVVKVISNLLIRIRDTKTGRVSNVHNRLKPYVQG